MPCEFVASGECRLRQEPQFGAEQSHPLRAGIREIGQVGHDPRIDVKGDCGPIPGGRRLVPDMAVLFPFTGAKADPVPERVDNFVAGAKICDPPFPIHEHMVPIEGFGRDVLDMDQQGDGHGAGDDGCVRADGPPLEQDALQTSSVF